jgi:hypothetical protein
MNTWIQKPLLITLSIALFCAALRGRAQDSPPGSDTVQFVTGDAGGDAIPIARLTAEHGWVGTPDTDRHAEIEYEPNSSFGISVRVSAPDPQLRHADQSDIIYMEKETNRLVRSASTVSIRELCPAVQQRSQKLQQEALEALQRGEDEVALQLLSEALHLTPSTREFEGDCVNELDAVRSTTKRCLDCFPGFGRHTLEDRQATDSKRRHCQTVHPDDRGREFAGYRKSL